MKNDVMQDALMAAMPELQEKQLLARQIDSVEQVVAMSTDDLERLKVEHENEIVTLLGRISLRPDTRWAVSARQALRVLNLHNSWIGRELTRRRRIEARNDQKKQAEEMRSAKLLAQQEHTQRQREAEAARLARIKASNDETAQHIAVFKEVAREALGAEMYAYLWELTKKRIDEAARSN